MRRLMFLAALVLMAATAFAQAPADDQKRLAGKWTPIVTDDDDVPLHETTVTFRGSTMTVEAKGVEAKGRWTFKLNPASTPKAVDFNHVIAGALPMPGIYEFKGDELWMCLRTYGDRPTEFRTVPDSDMHLMKLKRVK